MHSLVSKTIQAHLDLPAADNRRVYLLLYESLKRMIEAGLLPENALMPPTRLLAAEIGISRSTLVKAYNLLTENHLLKSRQGSGYVVTGQPRRVEVPQYKEEVYPDLSEKGRSFLHNRHLLPATNPSGVAFTPGLPPIDIFPIGQWQKLSNNYWRTIKSADLNYSISSGLDSLKKSIADYLLLSRRIVCDPDQVIIVSGSLQSLFLIGSVLIDRGDTVCMENPTFPNVISIFKSLEADVCPVPVADDGACIEAIPTTGRRLKIIHVTPSNQYPLGGKMPLERRLQLLETASQAGAIVIENDYEHEFNNWHDPVDSIFSLDRQHRTIYLSTFNRILHPSIRLGYMILPHHLLPSVKAFQMHSHRFVPQSLQVMMTDFINQYHLSKHVHRAIAEAEDRRAHFVDQFCRHVGSMPSLQNQRVDSFHLLADMAPTTSDQALVKALDDKGIVTHALSKCYVDGPVRQGLILGYSCVNKSFMGPAVQKMAGIVGGGRW